MKKLALLLLSLLLLFTFNACEDTSDPEGPAALLVRTTWKVDGIYANNSKVPGTEFNISMRFTATPALVNINGIPGSVWSLNDGGTQMTLTYPSSATGLQFSSNNVDFTVSQTSLVFKAPAGQDLSFFGGLIVIQAGAELRLIPQDAAPTAPVTNSALTTGTWTSTGNDMAGLFDVSQDPAVRLINQPPTLTLRFRTILGINTLTISGIPSPAVWSLSSNNQELGISFPSGQNEYKTVTFQISELSATKLNFSNSVEETVLGIPFNADNELRMIQQ